MVTKVRLKTILLVLLFTIFTGVTTQASTIVPVIMLLLGDDTPQINKLSNGYDEVQLDLVILE